MRELAERPVLMAGVLVLILGLPVREMLAFELPALAFLVLKPLRCGVP